MTCEEYLALHSEFLDEELGADATSALREHASVCQACARYDRVLRRGLDLLRSGEPVEPTEGEEFVLERVLAREAAREVTEPAGIVPRLPLAGSVAVAGLVALIAWSALFRATGVPTSAAGALAGHAPAAAGPTPSWQLPVSDGADSVGAALPIAAAGIWSEPAVPPPHRRVARRRSPLQLPGPYTPLEIAPPDYGQAVPVLASFTH